MDDRLLEHLVEEGVPTFSMASGLTLDDFGWGTPTFHKMASAPRGAAGRWLGAARPHARRWRRASAPATSVPRGGN